VDVASLVRFWLRNTRALNSPIRPLARLAESQAKQSKAPSSLSLTAPWLASGAIKPLRYLLSLVALAQAAPLRSARLRIELYQSSGRAKIKMT